MMIEILGHAHSEFAMICQSIGSWENGDGDGDGDVMDGGRKMVRVLGPGRHLL